VSSWQGFPWQLQNSHTASKGARQEARTWVSGWVSGTGTDHSAGCTRSPGCLVHSLYRIKRAPFVKNTNT
jgi:hypothetical protein